MATEIPVILNSESQFECIVCLEKLIFILPSRMSEIPTSPKILKPRPSVEEVVVGTPTKCFSFQPPIPLCSDGSLDSLLGKTCGSEASHKAGIILDEMGKPLEERFTFWPPLPLRSADSSAMETLLARNCMAEASKNTSFTLDEMGQPLVERFSFRPPLPLRSKCRMKELKAKEVTRILRFKRGEKGQKVVDRVIFLPVPHPDVGYQHCDPEKLKMEPLSKRFRFQPPIPLRVDGSLAMESSNEDAADEDKDPAEAKEAETNEIINEIEEAAEEKVSSTLLAPSAGPQPSGLRFQDRTWTEVCGQSLKLAYFEEESNNKVAVAKEEIRPRYELRPRRNSPIDQRMCLGGAPSVTKSKYCDLLEVIDEQSPLHTPSLPLTRLRSRVCKVDTNAETPTKMVSNSRMATRSEGSIVERLTPRPTRMGPIFEPKTVRTLRTRSRRNSSGSSSAVSPIPAEAERRTGETNSNQNRKLRPRRHLEPNSR